MSVFKRHKPLSETPPTTERRRIPIVMKIFLGFVALLAVVLIGNIVFLYQLSRLNRIIKSTSNGMYRIVLAQDMRKKLILQKRYRGVYQAMKTDVSVSEAEGKLENFENNLNDETKRLTTRYGRNLGPIDKLNDLSDNFIDKSKIALHYVDCDSFESAYSIIRSDSFITLAGQIRDEIEKSDKRYGLRILPSDFGSIKSSMENAVLRPYYRHLFKLENDSLRVEADSLDILLSAHDTTGEVLKQYIDTLSAVFSREIRTGKIDSSTWNKASDMISSPLDEILSSEVAGVSQTFRKSQLAVAVTRTIGIWGGLGLFGLGILIAIIVSRKIASPIAELRSATHSAAKGEWEKRITPSTNDEIGDLTEDFNTMLRELGELDVMKSRFLASITHDLKSPIGRVRGNIANLQDELLGPVTDGQSELLDMMSKDVDKLSRLIHDILDLQKMKAGAFKLDITETDLKPFILDILEQHAQVLIEKGIELGIKLDIENKTIYLDRKQIERVFDNLVSNAIKYTQAGGKIIIEAYPENNNVLFRIIDTGVGIPQDHLEHVFDEFYQAGQKVKGVKGTGLGLTIVKQIVEAHAGKIWVESLPKVGTVFAFKLPLERPK